MWEGSNTEDDAEFDQFITEQEIPDSRADDETVEKELEAHGCEDFTRLSARNGRHGHGVYQATRTVRSSGSGSGGAATSVTMCIYVAFLCNIASDHNLRRLIVRDLLKQCAITHPHIVAPKSLIRTESCLCVLTAHVNGGDVFRMVLRGGRGLPVAAARFLFQQLVLTTMFAHLFAMFLVDIKPSRILVFWNARGMPILKISFVSLSMEHLLRTAHEALPGPPLCTPSTQATMYMCPQLLREAVRGHEHEAEVLAVADIWALAVILYFLLFGCWPFSQDQIRQWPVTPAAEWRDDAAVSYELAPGVSGEPAPPLDADVLACLQTVFRGGGLSMQDFAKQCPTLHDLVGLPWFQRDLPAGAVDMPEQYRDETEQRRNSEGYAAVRATLDNL